MYLYVKDPLESKYQQEMKSRYWINKKSKYIHWLLSNNWWCLWKFGRLESNKKKKSVNSVWWCNSTYRS